MENDKTAIIWQQEFTLEGLNNMNAGTICSHIGLEFTKIGRDYLEATLPLDERTRQPYGLLHGGASVVLAETLGSIASVMSIANPENFLIVGLEVNANHLRAVRKGPVRGRVTPIRIGRSVHVWNIDIFDVDNKQSCISRITISIQDRKK